MMVIAAIGMFRKLNQERGDSMKHPNQAIITSADGSWEGFRSNEIVVYLKKLATAHGTSLNELAEMFDGDRFVDDWSQFCQLIGYSVNGYKELSFVDQTRLDEPDESPVDNTSVSDPTQMYVVFKTDYDDCAILGVYDSIDLATAERDRCEQLHQKIDLKFNRRRRSEDSVQFSIGMYTVNETLAQVSVTVRADGHIDHQYVSFGDRAKPSVREKMFYGTGTSLEGAISDALKSDPE